MAVTGFSVRGRTAATAATAGHAIAQLWNQHSTQRMLVTKIQVFKQGGAGTAGDAWEVRRSTARGTPGSTITPALAQDENRSLAPVTGLLDLAAFTVQPTLEAGGLDSWVAANVIASGIILPVNIEVPPGAGIVLAQIAASIWPVSEVVFRAEEL